MILILILVNRKKSLEFFQAFLKLISINQLLVIAYPKIKRITR